MTMLIRLSDQDNVAVAGRSISQGAALEIDGQHLEAKDPIPARTRSRSGRSSRTRR
jgi:hypothetical protein